MSGPVTTPTRAAVLQMQEEQGVVKEAYTFLDEKRLLLASELLRQLKLYQQQKKQLDVLHARASDAMRLAVMQHGFDYLQVYPAGINDRVFFNQHKRNFMGVTLVEIEQQARGADIEAAAKPLASIVSVRAEICRRLFCDIVESSAAAAAVSGNLYRLLREYRLTERRSRALENVILPEIEQKLREMNQHLEELDLEDAIRVHLQSGTPG
jgi:V/A-type H+-transporting ATPase subunit D